MGGWTLFAIVTTKAEEHEGHNVIMMHTLGERVKVSSEQ